MGKSRLVWEVAQSRRTGEWLVLQSSAVAYGRTTSYLPIIELIRSHCWIEPRDDAPTVREKVLAKLQSLDAALESSLPALISLLDVPIDDPDWQALDPPQRRARTQEAV